jgi:hypothetical protein
MQLSTKLANIICPATNQEKKKSQEHLDKPVE